MNSCEGSRSIPPFQVEESPSTPLGKPAMQVRACDINIEPWHILRHLLIVDVDLPCAVQAPSLLSAPPFCKLCEPFGSFPT